MTQKLIKFKNVSKNFLPRNSFVSIASMVTAFIVSIACSYICYIIFKNGDQAYSDIVVGNITTLGLFKSIDFYIYYTFIIVYIIMFLGLNCFYNKKIKNMDDTQVELNQFHIFFSLLPAILVLLFKINYIPIFYLCFIMFIIVVIMGMRKYGMKDSNISKIAVSCFFMYLSSAGVLALVNYYMPNIADKVYKYFIPLLWVLLSIASYFLYIFAKSNFKNEDAVINRILAITQLIVPFILFSLINTRFFYRGTPYIPIYYERFKNIILFVIVILCLSNLFTLINSFIKSKINHSVSLNTIIPFVAVCFWNTGYNLVIDADQFHTGEVAIVYQQIIDFGQKWGSEFTSVLQGLGFSLSWLNDIVFGGTFATFTQTNNLLLIIIAILTIIFLYQIIDHKWLVLLVAPILPTLLMNRTFLIAPVYLFLLNKKLISNPVKWTYGYILSCIICVWYQPTYGGAVAASLIPVLIYIWYKEFKNKTVFDLKNKKSLLKFGFFLLSIIIIGISCIPMIMNAIHFLKTNGYETLIANGINISQTIAYQPSFLTGYALFDRILELLAKYGTGLLSIIIMLYVFLRYVVSEKDNVKQIQGFILTVSTIISYSIMLPAILTRIDPGITRIGFVGFIYFGFLTWILLYLFRNNIRLKPLAFIIGGVALATGLYIINPAYFQIHQKAYGIVTIPDNAIYTNPKENKLDNLGYAFVSSEQYLNEAMTINELCNILLNKNQTYYDLTDKSIYYLLTNKKVPGLYVSPIVCANEFLQTESIKQLKKNDVPIVFINQPLNYIGVSQSLRSYRLYRYFLDQDYNFVRYKRCNFLIRSDIDLKLIQNQIESIDLSNQVGICDDLIDESSYNSSLLEKLTIEDIVASRSIEIVDNHMKITAGGDSHAIFHSDNQIDYNNIQLFEIKLRNQPTANMTGQIFLDTERVSQNENNSIQFKVESNRILIPVYKFEQLKLDTKLVNFRIDFDNVAEGTDVTVDSINIYTLDEDQIANIANQFDEIEKGVPDNRLDDIFHQPNLMYLPSQWGKSFELMSNRFIASDSIENKQKQVTDIPYNNYFKFVKGVPGDKGEFLRLKLDCGNNNNLDATLILKGINKNGNNLHEEFQFVANGGDVLIPIASSPNCLQSQKITGFDIIFSSSGKKYNVGLEEAVLYQLIK